MRPDNPTGPDGRLEIHYIEYLHLGFDLVLLLLLLFLLLDKKFGKFGIKESTGGKDEHRQQCPNGFGSDNGVHLLVGGFGCTEISPEGKMERDAVLESFVLEGNHLAAGVEGAALGFEYGEDLNNAL